MENAKKVSISIFIIASVIAIIFFCPITIYVTEQSINKYNNNVVSTKYYTYEVFEPIWDISGGSYPSFSGSYNISTNKNKRAEINFGKLCLEELSIAGISFVIYIALKSYMDRKI